MCYLSSFQALKIIHVGFGMLVIYIIVYFRMVFDVVFQKCKNFCTYVF